MSQSLLAQPWQPGRPDAAGLWEIGLRERGLRMVHETGGIGAPQPNQPERIPPAQQVGSTPGDQSTGATGATGEVSRGQDNIEISSEARLLQQLSELSDVRADKVAEARQKIAAGEFDGDDVLQAAIDRMIEESI